MTAEELFNKALYDWRNAKGKGTFIIPFPFDDKLVIAEALKKIYSKDFYCHTTIIVNDFNERHKLIEYIKNNTDDNIKYFLDDRLNVFTKDYLLNKPVRYYKVFILYNVVDISEFIYKSLEISKFNLVVFNKLPITNIIDKVYKISPLIKHFTQKEFNDVKLSSPVEEVQIPVYLPEDSDDKKCLDKFTEYITTSINIFGSFDILRQAHSGNIALNISPMQICAQIAKENGWNPKLDMNVEFNREIDKLYNPGQLKDRAINTYDIIRNRNNLLSDYEGKLFKIYEIFRDNPTEKYLIISKRADFAVRITEFLNEMFGETICMNYHDKVKTIDAVDSLGNPIFYKSGINKGKRKTMGAKAQKTLAVQLFNSDVIRALSTNNAPDKDLNIIIDGIIITSPMCEELQSYLYRLSKVYFRLDKIKLFSLYCGCTTEQTKLESKSRMKNHNVKSDLNDNFDCDFVVVD